MIHLAKLKINLLRAAKSLNPAHIYLFKVNYRNTRKRCEICSKLTIKTPERRHLLLTLNIFHILF